VHKRVATLRRRISSTSRCVLLCAHEPMFFFFFEFACSICLLFLLSPGRNRPNGGRKTQRN
jgi:hypothetical protein